MHVSNDFDGATLAATEYADPFDQATHLLHQLRESLTQDSQRITPVDIATVNLENRFPAECSVDDTAASEASLKTLRFPMKPMYLRPISSSSGLSAPSEMEQNRSSDTTLREGIHWAAQDDPFLPEMNSHLSTRLSDVATQVDTVHHLLASQDEAIASIREAHQGLLLLDVSRRFELNEMREELAEARNEFGSKERELHETTVQLDYTSTELAQAQAKLEGGCDKVLTVSMGMNDLLQDAALREGMRRAAGGDPYLEGMHCSVSSRLSDAAVQLGKVQHLSTRLADVASQVDSVYHLLVSPDEAIASIQERHEEFRLVDVFRHVELNEMREELAEARHEFGSEERELHEVTVQLDYTSTELTQAKSKLEGSSDHASEMFTRTNDLLLEREHEFLDLKKQLEWTASELIETQNHLDKREKKLDEVLEVQSELGSAREQLRTQKQSLQALQERIDLYAYHKPDFDRSPSEAHDPFVD